MLNHVLTLLKNAPAGPAGPGDSGELCDPGFRPVELPPELKAVWTALFGSDPDRLGLDLRAWQLLALLHSTELSEDARLADPRISYLPLDPPAGLAPWVAVTTAAGAAALHVEGSPRQDPAGRSEIAWKIEVVV